jgi:hypothetical protein
MAISGLVSIPSAVGSSTVLTVTGAKTLEFAQVFQSVLDAAIKDNSLALSEGSSASPGVVSFGAAVAGKTNEAVVSSNQGGGVGIGTSSTVPAGYQFLFDNVNGATTVQGPSTGISGIFAGDGSAATFVATGGGNTIIFVDGNNTFQGDMRSSSGTDSIAGGTGFDTINTGIGSADVFAGVGQSRITLNDTAAGTPSNTNFNDYAYLADGHSTVFANGKLDAILASAPGQVIYGGDQASDYTAVALLPVAGSTVGSADQVFGDAATVAAFDQSGGNTVTGGSGFLQFIGGQDVAATVGSGSGTTYIFGGAGDSITWTTPVAGGTSAFIGGLGAETIDASKATSGVTIFGYQDTSSAIGAELQSHFIGGSGNDTLVSGGGNETLDGGSGNNVFVIAKTEDGVGAHITLGDFGSSADNVIAFSGYTQAQIDTALAGAHTTTTGLGSVATTFTLSDNTTVSVVGISSLNGHTFGG